MSPLCQRKAFRLDLKAIKSYQNYLLLYPGDAKETFVRLQIGNLHVTKGNYTGAIQDFALIPQGSAERAEAQYHIGECYKNLHQDSQAQEAYQKLLSIGPRDNEFRIAGLLELAKMIEGKGSTQGLTTIYSDIASSSHNQQIVQARWRRKIEGA